MSVETAEPSARNIVWFPDTRELTRFGLNALNADWIGSHPFRMCKQTTVFLSVWRVELF